MSQRPLRVRWLGRVRYRDAHALQRALFQSSEDYLLLLEHPHVYTRGVRARPENLLSDVVALGADLVDTDRGGDITYHGPGQLVGYPLISLALRPRLVPEYMSALESIIIEALTELGVHGATRIADRPGVWITPAGEAPRKICAIGVRISRGRTMHGFALNVAPDLAMFDHIVPCGIPDAAVTSISAEGVQVSMAEVVEVVLERARCHLGEAAALPRTIELMEATSPSTATDSLSANALPQAVRLQERVGKSTSAATAIGRAPASHRRLASAGVDTSTAVTISARKPEWLRVEAEMGSDYLRLRKTMRSLDLVTVCEEAGCPNIYDCWSDGTATFMINGERCTRACGFCLVDTRHPLALDPEEPRRVAEAVRAMGLSFAVVTTVARDDLDDDGAGAFAETIAAIRSTAPGTQIEVLISDCRGKDESLATIFAARPEILNHNLETVLRLQRAARPSASYARSLSVLARAKEAGLVTKSGIILGMGEERDEVLAALRDLASVGVDIVTIGQYLRPSQHHLPVARYWTPDEFEEIGERAREMGFSHVESSPLTRSSYHARQAAATSVAASVSA